jgi:hypothetical protein
MKTRLIPSVKAADTTLLRMGCGRQAVTPYRLIRTRQIGATVIRPANDFNGSP